MNTHVFIVDSTTFKYHLEYKFAGTGSKKNKSPFLVNCSYSNTRKSVDGTTDSQEKSLVAMIADISRIRIGDKVIFYLQATKNNSGMFFGVFKAESLPFFDENDEANYLKDKLDKRLSFRILISADEVYSKGISEHEYLDSLKNKNHPSDLCWSLIYRKLRANRGCTMIMDYEYNDLLNKLKNKNNNCTINSTSFTFDSENNEIVQMSKEKKYKGKKNSLEILDRMCFRCKKNNAFEVHLQAYLTKNFDDNKYKNILMPLPNEGAWIGNEVSCGVGMQRIDLMIKQETDTDVYIKLLELKCVPPYKEIIDKQIPWYIEWLSDYVIPKYKNKKVHLIPSIIARGELTNELKNHYEKFKIEIESVDVKSLEYIGFNIEENNITLTKYL